MATVRAIFTPSITNRLLAELSFSDLAMLRPTLQRVRLVRDQVLIEPGQATTNVFFIETGIVTLLARRDPSKAGVQVAMIGMEGMVGGLGLLDDQSGPYAGAVVQVPGGALRMPLSRLRECIEERTAIRDVMLRFVQSLTRQIMDIAAGNANHTLIERCVHWLLMAHERMDGDDLPITHEVLSSLLGVRRSGVTLAAALLQDSGLISNSRGRIRVLDRAGLLAFSASRASHPVPSASDRSSSVFHGKGPAGDEHSFRSGARPHPEIL